jgi:hypothetical protein
MVKKMMHTTNILTYLKTQENILKVKIREKESENQKNELTTLKVLGLKLFNNVLEGACTTIWMLHLLKTSLLITKTPLTTLKSIVKGSVPKRH